MTSHTRPHGVYSRREFGKLALAGLALPRFLASPPFLAPLLASSRINGVQIGAITYSFRSISDVNAIIKAMAQIGLSEAELMSNHAEAVAGAPTGRAAGPGGGGRGRAMTAEQQAAQQTAQDELRKWRLSTSPATFKAVTAKFATNGIEIALLCYNMGKNITDDEIEYAFQMAKALGAKAISTTTQVSVSKRVAPFADKHKMMVGYHGHSNITDPGEFATPESFATAMSYSKFHGVNLDIGHFTAANYDAVAYIQANHARITNLHLKDRRRNQGPNVPWGQGDTPIKAVLQLLRQQKWDIPANIEYEYQGQDTVAEVAKCYEYCKDMLA
jgi:sugar phosphate isomerase/epimerase